jgi:carboxylesterase
VFIHGFMGSPRQFDKLAQTVHRLGYSAASLLLPGHDCSARGFASGTFERWQQYVDDEYERLSRDYESIWLVGHSMGGLLAVNTAVRHGDRIRGLFLISSPLKIIFISAHAVKVRLQLIFCRRSNPVKAAYLIGNSIKLTPDLLWHIIKPAIEFLKLMKVAQGNLPDVRPRLMAFYSASDELVSLQSLKILKSGLTGASVEYHVLTDSLHAYYPEHEYVLIEQALVKMLSLH